MSNDCHKTRWIMEREMDGEALSSERDFLKSHAQDCSSCRTLLEGNRRWLEQMRAAPLPNAPEGFAERVMSNLERQGRVQRSRRIPLAAALALAASIAIVLGALALHSSRTPPKGQKPEIMLVTNQLPSGEEPLEAVQFFASCVNSGISGWVLESSQLTGEVAASSAEGLGSLGSLFGTLSPFGTATPTQSRGRF